MNRQIWICALVKHEEFYIKEWIEYHKKLGIDHIVLIDNNESSHEPKLFDIVQNEIKNGFVELVYKQDVIPGTHFQMDCYKEVYNLKRNCFDYIGFIDIDEFIELPAYKNIQEFVYDKKFENYNVICLQWLTYSDSEKLFFEDKPVRERFKQISKIFQKRLQTAHKLFVKSISEMSIFGKHEFPYTIKFSNEEKIKPCNSLGELISEEYFNFENHIRPHIDNRLYEQAYLAHYPTKTIQEYVMFKVNRGDVIYKKTYKYDYNWFLYHNGHSSKKLDIYNLLTQNPML